jgi:hypothetical protein
VLDRRRSSPDRTDYADPLPQALVLTAIVISFGMTALIVLLALRAFIEKGDDRIDDRPSEARRVPRPPGPPKPAPTARGAPHHEPLAHRPCRAAGAWRRVLLSCCATTSRCSA